MRATCVDTDEKKIVEMDRLYPSDWTFWVDDVYEFSKEEKETFDVVSLDPSTNQFVEVVVLTERWCSLARHLVVIGSSARSHESIVAPRGWRKLDPRLRSSFRGGTYWTPLVRA